MLPKGGDAIASKFNNLTAKRLNSGNDAIKALVEKNGELVCCIVLRFGRDFLGQS